MMKKLISILCVLAMVIGVVAVTAVSVGAEVDSAKTVIDVKKGQDVTYHLKLSDVDSKVIGTDFSIYYDSSVLETVSVMDYNDNDIADDSGSILVNTNLDGEVRGNWSVLNGVKFSEPRSYITVKFKAKADASTNISYFVRFLYDYKIFLKEAMESKKQPQITKFKFTCDVTVDGDPVIEDAQPELNVDAPQSSGGIFINSVTGDSSDVDVDVPGVVVNKEKAVIAYDYSNKIEYDPGAEERILVDGDEVSDNLGEDSANSNNGGSGEVGAVSNVNSGNSGNSSSAPEVISAPPATTSDGYFVTATDASGKVTATSDEAPTVSAANTIGTSDNKGGSSPVIWIIIALVVLAGGGAGVYFYTKKKKAPVTEAAPESDSVLEVTEDKE